MEECVATSHAYDRAKERLGWSTHVLDKMMQKAFVFGAQHKDTKGTLNRYITGLWFAHRNSNNVRIYGEVIYFFAGQTLITLYHLKPQLRKHLTHLRKV